MNHKNSKKHTKEERDELLNEQFNGIMLEEHNMYREMHGVPHLVLNESLAIESQRYVNQIALNGFMVDSHDGKG